MKCYWPRSETRKSLLFTLAHHVLVSEIVGYLQMLSVVGHEVKLLRVCYLLMWNVIGRGVKLVRVCYL